MNIEQLVIKNLKTLGLRYHLYSSCTIKLAKKGFCMAACVFLLKKYKFTTKICRKGHLFFTYRLYKRTRILRFKPETKQKQIIKRNI